MQIRCQSLLWNAVNEQCYVLAYLKDSPENTIYKRHSKLFTFILTCSTSVHFFADIRRSSVNFKLRLRKCTNYCQEINKEAQIRPVQLTKGSSSHLQQRWLSRWGLQTHKRVLEEAAIESLYFNSTCLSHGLNFNLLDGVHRDKIPLNQGTFCFFRSKDLGIKTKEKVWEPLLFAVISSHSIRIICQDIQTLQTHWLNLRKRLISLQKAKGSCSNFPRQV